ncbi:MAG: hypothetical protein Q8R37_04970 [Nanoarchaeota archaeon]|nr:hypothetical protein [Nanoarchaeota archaeon]
MSNKTILDYLKSVPTNDLIAETFARLIIGKLSSQNYDSQLVYWNDAVNAMLDNDNFEGIHIIKNGNNINLNETMFDAKGDYIIY